MLLCFQLCASWSSSATRGSIAGLTGAPLSVRRRLRGSRQRPSTGREGSFPNAGWNRERRKCGAPSPRTASLRMRRKCRLRSSAHSTSPCAAGPASHTLNGVERRLVADPPPVGGLRRRRCSIDEPRRTRTATGAAPARARDRPPGSSGCPRMSPLPRPLSARRRTLRERHASAGPP